MKGIVLSKKTFAVYCALVTMLAAQIARAQDVSFGQPTYGGTGCPAPLAPQLSLAKGLLSVRFNKFQLDDGVGNPIGRKNCSIRLPINVKGNYRIAVQNAELRGVARVPAETNLQIRTDIGFIGLESVAMAQSISTPSNINVSLKGVASILKFTKCGESAMLSLNTSLLATKRAQVSGLRAQARVQQVKLVIEKCN